MARLSKKEVTKEELHRIEGYVSRYNFTDTKIHITWISNKRRVYLFGTDQDNIDYKIPFTYIQKAGSIPPNFRHCINKDELFIKRSSDIYKHKDKYDYSLVKNGDITRNRKVTLICKINNHGKFKVRYDLHLYNRNGCPLCGEIILKRLNTFQ